MNIRKRLTGCALLLLAALVLLGGLGTENALAQKLYISDAGDNSVKVVDLDLNTVDFL
jgi:hypothetical protein